MGTRGRNGEVDHDAECMAFLLDGVRPAPSPAVLLALEAPDAEGVALSLHERGDEIELLTPPGERLIGLDTGALATLDEEGARELCADLARAQEWAYLPVLPGLIDGGSPAPFLSVLAGELSRGSLATVLLQVPPAQLGELQRSAVRLAGLAHVVTRDESGGLALAPPPTSIARQALDDADTGWLVCVRFDVQRPVSTDAPGPVNASGSAWLALVQGVQHLRVDEHAGALVTFRPDAFTVSQQSAAFAAAESAGRHLVGRQLECGESVTAVRALYYG